MRPMTRMGTAALLLALAMLAARGESLAAFDGRCIPAGCVAPRSNTPGILGRRALPSGRLARLGATPDFRHGLLDTGQRLLSGSSPVGRARLHAIGRAAAGAARELRCACAPSPTLFSR